MRLLAALAVFGAIGAFGAVSSPANAQVYPDPDFNVTCDSLTLTFGPEDTPIITATVVDLDNGGQPVQGVTVNFTTTGGGSVNPTSGVTDINGEVQTTLDPEGALSTITVTATLQGEQTSCTIDFDPEEIVESFTQDVESATALPATGSGGATSGGSPFWAFALIGALGLAGLTGISLKVARS